MLFPHRRVCFPGFAIAEIVSASKLFSMSNDENPSVTPPAAAAIAKPVSHPRDPLHGITLEKIVNQLVQRHGWNEMARRIPVRCFQFHPTTKSSLTFLRKTPWARKRVEDWFIREL